MSKNLFESINSLDRLTNSITEDSYEESVDKIDNLMSMCYEEYKNSDYVPTKEDLEVYTDLTDEEYQDAIEELKKLNELPRYNDLLELSDNHTLNDLGDKIEKTFGVLSDEDSELATDIYNKNLQTALDSFEENTGVECYTEGRMGRHICVEDTYSNASRFEELQKVQKEMEDTLIDEVVTELENEIGSDDTNESENITEDFTNAEPTNPEEIQGFEGAAENQPVVEADNETLNIGDKYVNDNGIGVIIKSIDKDAEGNDQVTFAMLGSRTGNETHHCVRSIDSVLHMLNDNGYKKQEPINEENYNASYYIEEIGFDPYKVDYSKNPKAEEIINLFKQAGRLGALFDYTSAGLAEPFETEEDYLNYIAGTDIDDFGVYNEPLKTNESVELKEEVLSDNTVTELESLQDRIHELQSTIKHTVVDEIISINSSIENINDQNKLSISTINENPYYNTSEVDSDIAYEIKNSEWSKEDVEDQMESVNISNNETKLQEDEIETAHDFRDDIFEACEAGTLSWETVARATIYWIPSDDAKALIRANDWPIGPLSVEEESEELTESSDLASKIYNTLGRLHPSRNKIVRYLSKQGYGTVREVSELIRDEAFFTNDLSDEELQKVAEMLSL